MSRGSFFDITQFRCDPKFHNLGLGREAFHVLVDPEFGLPGTPSSSTNNHTRALSIVISGQVKAHPIDLLRGMKL